MTWIAAASDVPVATVAEHFGLEVRRHPSASSTVCPACGAERRHPSRRDRRGAVGIAHAKPNGWRCFACDASGDAIDFAAYKIGGARFRDLTPERKAEVRDVFERRFGVAASYSAAVQRSPVHVARTYPPAAEVREIWESCLPVTRLAAVSGYLAFRGIDPREIASRDLARALPTMPLPAWARLGERTWIQSGHRLIVPLFDALGELRSVLARSVERKPTLKSTAPRGFGRGGLIMASALARGMLKHSRAPRWWPSERPFETLVREGEIDFLQSAAVDQGGAVLGIVSGSWTPGLAARLPEGTHVIIATDADAQGDKYAAAIAGTLEGHARWTRKREAA